MSLPQPTDDDRWTGVYLRLQGAEKQLTSMVNDASPSNFARLSGKLEGVKLAISFMEEENRVRSDQSST